MFRTVDQHSAIVKEIYGDEVKMCFLTLHHEGVRGGITQFNKISRFCRRAKCPIEIRVQGYRQTGNERIT